MSFKSLLFFEIKRFFNKKSYFLFFTIAPLLVLGLFSYIVSPIFYENNYVSEFTVALVNNDKNSETELIARQLMNSPSINNLINTIKTDNDTAFQLLKNEKVSAVIVIPEDLNEGLKHGNPREIKIYGINENELEGQIAYRILNMGGELVSTAQNYVDAIWEMINHEILEAKIDSDTYSKIANSYYFNILARTQVFERNKESISPFLSFLPIEYYASSIIVIFILLSSMFIMKNTIEDISNRIGLRIITSNTKELKYVTAKTLSSAISLSAQFGIVTILIIIFSQKIYNGNIMTAVIALLSICLFAGSLMQLIANCTNNLETSSGIAFFVVFVLMFFGGGIIPFPFLPEFIEKVSVISPVNWAINALINSIFDNNITKSFISSINLIFFSLIITVLNGLLIKKKMEGIWTH